jgi:hypothetical protein
MGCLKRYSNDLKNQKSVKNYRSKNIVNKQIIVERIGNNG